MFYFEKPIIQFILTNMKITLGIITIILILSCKSKIEYNYNGVIEKVYLAKSSFLNNQSFFKDISYIKLSISERDGLFSEINKILIKNDLIYLLDATGQQYVYIFNLKGDFIQRIGKKGKGPGEYLRISDFDVDEKGNMFLCDRQGMRIIKYNEKGELIDDKRMPFRAEAINLLEGGDFIFSVEKNSSRPIFGSKVVVTDSSFKVKHRYFLYDKNSLDDKMNFNIFRETKEGIIYHKPVCDNLYLFDNKGIISKEFHLDFGNRTVPKELKNSYEKLVIERGDNNYEYFYDPPFFARNYLIGNIFNGQSKAFLLYSLKDNIAYQHDIRKETFTYLNINFPLTVINDTIVVSYLDRQLYEGIADTTMLNLDIRQHLKNGGTVLSFYTLK